MPYPADADIIAFFTGPFDTSTASPLVKAIKIAIPDGYPGILAAATQLEDCLAVLDGLSAVSGYSPTFGVATDGDRLVLEVTGWTGGAGTPPATGFIGGSGIVPDVADGVNIRGLAGAAGDQGPQGSYIVEIFQVSATVPTTPTGGLVNIMTGVVTPPADWDLTPSTPGSGESLYTTHATINPGTAMTANVIPTWSMPFVAGAQGPTGPQGPQGQQGGVGPAGADGTDGLRGPSVQLIYQVAATAPAAASSGAGIDADGILNAAPAGWALVASVPPVGQFLWVQVLIVESDNTIQYGGVARWTGEIGATGSTGQRGQSIQYVYQAAAAAPAAASTGAVVDSDGLLTTAPPGWVLDPPTASNRGTGLCPRDNC